MPFAALESLVQALPVGLLVETADRRVSVANRTFCAMFSIPAPPEALVGADCVAAAHASAPLAADPEAFLARIEHVVAARTDVRGDEVRLADGTVLERDFLMVDLGAEEPQIVWLYRDITPLVQARAAAESARDGALSMARQRSSMLATLAHEVRSPLAGMIGMVDALGAAPLPAWARETVEATRRAGDRLSVLLTDLLDLGRLDVEDRPPRLETFSLDAVLCEAVEMVGATARRSGTLLTSVASPDMPRTLVGDESRIRQVVLNLVTNAIKFAPGGEVVVSVEPEGAGMRLCVEDDGPGVPDGWASRIFEPFVQADGDPHLGALGGSQGVGLGLSITAQLVHHMGGAIHVETRDPHGARFVVWLPVAAPEEAPEAPEEAAPLAEMVVVVSAPTQATRSAVAHAIRAMGGIVLPDTPAEGVAGGERVDAVVAIGDASSPEFAGQVEALSRAHGDAHVVVLTRRDVAADAVPGAVVLGLPPTPAKLARALRGGDTLRQSPATAGLPPLDARVLVVEDDEATRLVVEAMLVQLGAQVRSTASSAEAVGIALAGEADIVLMDFHLPDGDAVRIVTRIRAGTERGRIPLAILSGSTGGAERAAAMSAGADAFLTKPVTAPELHEALAALLSPGVVVGRAAETSWLSVLVEETGDAEVVLDALGAFLDELPARLERIRGAARDGSLAETRDAAHALRSPALMIGAHRLAEACRALEASRESREAAVGAETVVGEAGLVADALRAYISSAPGSA